MCTLTISIWRVIRIPIWQFMQLTDNWNMEGACPGGVLWGANARNPLSAGTYPCGYYARDFYDLTIWQKKKKSYLSASQIFQLNICYSWNIVFLCVSVPAITCAVRTQLVGWYCYWMVNLCPRSHLDIFKGRISYIKQTIELTITFYTCVKMLP